ncbi:MAG: chromate transporter [Caldisericaceae bacterium]|nr:chromate transporter [Caldisericaceae bacterium]
MNKKINVLKLFGIFFYIGLFTLGGGYAMIPIMKQKLTAKNRYISEDDFIEVLAVSQITPGPIAVNMATFIGYKELGVLGSITATLGVILPSLIIILLLSIYFTGITSNAVVRKFFSGILTGIVAEIVCVTIDITKKIKIDFFNLSILILSLVEIFIIKLNPIYVILVGGGLGILFKTREFKNVSS